MIADHIFNLNIWMPDAVVKNFIGRDNYFDTLSDFRTAGWYRTGYGDIQEEISECL